MNDAQEQALLQRIAALESENTSLRTRIAELEQLLRQAQETIVRLESESQRLVQETLELKQAPFRPRRRRSSQRSSSETPKRRGRPKGHVGTGRKRPTRVDQTERVSVGDTCPDCGASFGGAVVERERFIEDIEPVRPTRVTRYIIERRWCSCCDAFKEAPVTDALPRYRLGWHVMLFVVYQKVALGLSYGKIQHELVTYFSLHVSQGTLVRLVAEAARLFGPAYARLIRLMRQQSAIHVDETGWRIDGQNHWLWVFVNELVALYVISHSRGSKVPKALLGGDFQGVVISDFYSAYSPLDMEKAKCWVHLLRDSHDLTKGEPSPDSERLQFHQQFHQQLHQLFLDMGLALEEAAADETMRTAISQEMGEKLRAFAETSWSDPDCQRLAKRILKHLDELLVWLTNQAVSPDNNQAERALRPAVVTRKTSFGSRSKAGAQAFARLLSIIQTWQRQGIDFFDTTRATVAQASEN